MLSARTMTSEPGGPVFRGQKTSRGGTWPTAVSQSRGMGARNDGDGDRAASLPPLRSAFSSSSSVHSPRPVSSTDSGGCDGGGGGDGGAIVRDIGGGNEDVGSGGGGDDDGGGNDGGGRGDGSDGSSGGGSKDVEDGGGGGGGDGPFTGARSVTFAGGEGGAASGRAPLCSFYSSPELCDPAEVARRDENSVSVMSEMTSLSQQLKVSPIVALALACRGAARSAARAPTVRGVSSRGAVGSRDASCVIGSRSSSGASRATARTGRATPRRARTRTFRATRGSCGAASCRSAGWRTTRGSSGSTTRYSRSRSRTRATRSSGTR